MESNHPRSITPRNSVLKTGGATGPHPSPYKEIKHLARWRDRVQVRVTLVLHRACVEPLQQLLGECQEKVCCSGQRPYRFYGR